MAGDRVETAAEGLEESGGVAAIGPVKNDVDSHGTPFGPPAVRIDLLRREHECVADDEARRAVVTVRVA
jgi:hypothetical protein